MMWPSSEQSPSAIRTPRVDSRTIEDLVRCTETLLEQYSDWRAGQNGRDSAHTLVRVFGRLAEIVVDRLNQVPDRSFLGFLNLLGVDLLPPQAARVPLTFELVENASVEPTLAAQTRVA